MAVADDDLISGCINRPCGYARYAGTLNATLKNLDDAPTNGKRLSQCTGKPNRALITVEAQVVAWTDDPATDPTATIGTPIAVGQTLEYTGDLSKFRWIERAASAVVHVAYYNS